MNISVWKRQFLLYHIRRQKADEIIRSAEKKIIPAFQNAAKNIPAYRSLLKNKNVDPNSVKDIESFQKLVPIIDKNYFTDHPVDQLCRNWDPEKIRSITLSSGFSGNFAFNTAPADELNSLTFFVDVLLDLNVNISKKKTLCISSLGQGVKVYTSLPLAETSIRSDSVAAVVKKIGPYYDQIIIIGNVYFVKKIIEDGIDKGIDWKALSVNFFFGEDWFPENYRTYLGGLIGADFDDPQGKLLGSTLGVSELGLSLFQESRETIRIRRLAEINPRLRDDLYGPNMKTSPTLFHYHPSQIFLESLPEKGFVFTILDRKTMLPLIRYASGDQGKIIGHNDLKNILGKHGYDAYLPRLQNPLVWVMGRKGKQLNVNNVTVTPEEIKAGIYSNFATAQATTGYFRMSAPEGRMQIEIQLREKFVATDELKKEFHDAIAKYTSLSFTVILYPYLSFPYGMGLIYDRKFQYL